MYTEDIRWSSTSRAARLVYVLALRDLAGLNGLGAGEIARMLGYQRAGVHKLLAALRKLPFFIHDEAERLWSVDMSVPLYKITVPACPSRRLRAAITVYFLLNWSLASNESSLTRSTLASFLKCSTSTAYRILDEISLTEAIPLYMDGRGWILDLTNIHISNERK